MKPRDITKVIKKTITTFPAVILTGPRQSGKTTLLKNTFSKKYDYHNLENPDVQLLAKNDPHTFLSNIKKPAIIDEIQYVPELLSYIKTDIDDHRHPGRWILTGSQNFSLMHHVSQSLAGRAAILSLLPFSLSEQFADTNKKSIDLSDTILRGNYPEVANNQKIDHNLWQSSYISTFLERDIRNLSQVGDLNLFQIFLKSVAVRTGQILDLSSIAREIGVSVPTAKRWLSLLEASYQVFLLYPYFQNIGKRMIKSPKVYFTDTGLVSHLLGITSSTGLTNSPYFGSLFETFVVIDYWKQYYHHGQKPSMYFLRTRDGLEVDLILENNGQVDLVEIKSTATIRPIHASSLIKAQKIFGKQVNQSYLISNSKSSPISVSITNKNWLDLI